MNQIEIPAGAPEYTPRQPFESLTSDGSTGYMEGDADYLLSNRELAVDLLERHVDLLAAASQRDELRAEVERLRAALEEVTDTLARQITFHRVPEGGWTPDDESAAQVIERARDALASRPDERARDAGSIVER